MKKGLTLSIALVISSFASAQEPRSFKCDQSLPEFTLGETSNPTNDQIQELCACIWSSFPEGGWEQRTSEKIHSGEDPGWRGRGFISRFGQALQECGGYNL